MDDVRGLVPGRRLLVWDGAGHHSAGRNGAVQNSAVRDGVGWQGRDFPALGTGARAIEKRVRTAAVTGDFSHDNPQGRIIYRMAASPRPGRFTTTEAGTAIQIHRPATRRGAPPQLTQNSLPSGSRMTT